MLLNTLAQLALLCAVSCSPLVTHETRRDVPPGFTSKGPAPESDSLTMQFGLAARDVSGLEEKLKAISTPGRPDFRKWLSKEEVKSYMQPSNETLDAFNSLASANGLTPTVLSPHGDWLSLTLRVGTANKLFGADYQIFTHESLPQPIIRTLSISLPTELAGHVEVVYPSTSFPIPPASSAQQQQQQLRYRRMLESSRTRIDKRKRASSNSSSSSCDPKGPYSPKCLQEMYGIPSTPATQQNNNSIMVTGYFNIYPNETDVQTFMEQFRPDITPNTTYDLVQIANATNDPPTAELKTLQLEADLDVEWTLGLATGVPVHFLSVGLPSENDTADGDGLASSLLKANFYLEGLDNPPSVVTTSYGPMERDFEEGMARKICNSYMGLGARGISLLFGSGDGGVRGSHDNSSIPGLCESHDFLTVFPASCPWVTAVGATSSFSPEVATNLTGGGFSYVFPRPWYQDSAAETFLKSLPSDFPGNFNKSGRAYPDVSIQGGNLDYTYNGTTGGMGGTSFSSPIFASVVALINDRLVAEGKPVLGFLNPWVYANADAFTDITKGHNSGFKCPTSSVAFNATDGWDPLTGVDSPIFDKLLTAAMDC
ncbi:family S53 protease-like protein [Favolaschia claudopus]|uniref:tripeptidyl-peptidase II n=1 Tax=Favolaschia claudopus TaxID=2862362 RepID=A0AAW0CSL8_9AGAR